MAENVVGETGFEPATLCSQSSGETRNSAAFGVERAENAANGINAVAEGCLTDPAGSTTPTQRRRAVSDEVNLLPCPFCGCTNVYAVSPSLGHSLWHVYCDDCCAEGPTAPEYNTDDPERLAIAAWNRRFPQPGSDGGGA